jgi:hypothetical protein
LSQILVHVYSGRGWRKHGWRGGVYTKFGHGEVSESKHGFVGAWSSCFSFRDAKYLVGKNDWLISDSGHLVSARPITQTVSRQSSFTREFRPCEQIQTKVVLWYRILLVTDQTFQVSVQSSVMPIFTLVYYGVRWVNKNTFRCPPPMTGRQWNRYFAGLVMVRSLRVVRK